MDEIIVIDFGGQYTHLIARRIRDLGVYAEILPFDVNIKRVKEIMPKAIIFSGGPSSVYEENSPNISQEFFQYTENNKIPILGICYGHNLIICKYGGKVEPKGVKEYGKASLLITHNHKLFESLDKEETVWMSHGDQVVTLPEGFKVLYVK